MPSHRRRCCSGEAVSSRRAAWQLPELPAAASLRTAGSFSQPPVGEDGSEGKHNVGCSLSVGPWRIYH